jgi:hypothetical protein
MQVLLSGTRQDVEDDDAVKAARKVLRSHTSSPEARKIARATLTVRGLREDPGAPFGPVAAAGVFPQMTPAQARDFVNWSERRKLRFR